MMSSERMTAYRRWSILLYAVFLSTFLIAFFWAFRTSLTQMLSDVTSREISVRSTSSLNDSLIRASADLQSVASSSSYYFLESPQDDGIIYSGSVFGGIPYRFEILSKASSADFEAYVASGDTVEFVTYDANGVPYSQAAVSAGTAVNVPLPATSTGYVTVSSLGAKSEFEVGRHGSKFSHPYPSVQAYRLAGRAKEFLWIYRVSAP